jgi:hypothetical protein
MSPNDSRSRHEEQLIETTKLGSGIRLFESAEGSLVPVPRSEIEIETKRIAVVIQGHGSAASSSDA